MAITSLRMYAEPLREIGFAAISPVYMGIGDGIDHPARVLYFQNLTDRLIYFSFDGINDHFSLPALGYFVLDISANKTGPTEALYFSQGQRIYARCGAGAPGLPTAGTVQYATFYGSNY
jgi:hypothetical protein